MNIFICPVCRSPLEETERGFHCENGHGFDKAKDGYVHLMPSGKMNSKLPGDSREMLLARRRFLESGHYLKLAQILCSVCRAASARAPRGIFADLGCGEGYYTEMTADVLSDCENISTFVGIDISKEAVRLAAKRHGRVKYAAASVYDVPLPDGSAALALNVFAPLAEEELRRTVLPGGYFVYVVPGPRHLWEIKSTVYDEPYENPSSDREYIGFVLEDTVRLRYETEMDKADIMACFAMTPYFWRSPKEGTERLSKTEHLRCRIEFDVHTYKRI